MRLQLKAAAREQDGARSTLEHLRRRRLGGDGGTADVDGEVSVEAVARLVGQGLVAHRGGVEVQHIDAAEVALDALDKLRDAGRITGIDGANLDLVALGPKLLGEVPDLAFVAGAQDDLEALTGESLRSREAHARAHGRPGARTPSSSRRCARHTHTGARGSEVSPSRLLQDQFVQRQVGNRLAQPLVLKLQVFHPPDLIRLQAAELLAPAVVRHLGDAESADHVGHALALRDQHVRLPQLGDHILRLVPLRSHLSVLVLARKPYLRADHFSGSGPSGILCLLMTENRFRDGNVLGAYFFCGASSSVWRCGLDLGLTSSISCKDFRKPIGEIIAKPRLIRIFDGNP